MAIPRKITFRVPNPEFVDPSWFEFQIGRTAPLTVSLAMARALQIMPLNLCIDQREPFQVIVKCNRVFPCKTGDFIYCAMSGIWAVNRPERVSPCRVNVLVGDETIADNSARVNYEKSLKEVRLFMGAIAEKLELPGVQTLSDMLDTARILKEPSK